ncbi:MAG: serine/threonine-protein kinase [Pseudanabaenaceae cyanobacterium bins.68]|nr:serine/threonine-protein kinase [Pseudanabaenaceae cyanobacterium bins.68]
MSYCVNPNCSTPENTPQDVVCRNCGSPLLLRDRYRSSRPLGKGGFGATFLAADTGLPGHPTCVIKQLRPNTQSAGVMKMARELFEREAFTLGKIGNHPQIPRLLDYFEEGGNFYLVQEYVEGETLKQELERRGKFSEMEIRKILAELLPALGFIHQNGVIHRDIKPANIIRRKQDGQLVLIDFGAVSTQVNRSPSRDAQDPAEMLTNFAIGTPGFAPPEQMAMRPVYSSDLYALTMCCLYLMSYRSPKDFGYDEYTGQIDWRSHVTLSNDLAVIVDRLLQQSAATRYRTAEEVIEALANRDSTSLPQPLAIEQPSTVPGIQSTVQVVSERPEAHKRAARWHVTGIHGQVTRDQSRGGNELKGGRKIIAEYNHGRRNFGSQDHSKISLAGANLTGVIMNRSRLVEADFCQANLTNANFQGAIMTSAKLNGANLRGAKLFRTILNKADLGSACLDQADLKEANLQGAYMSKTDLSNADLSNANLKGAYLKQANLRGANLCGADLTGAQITGEQLATAKTNWNTIRPDGGKRLF